MEEQVLQIVKARLGIKDNTLDNLIQGYVLELKYKILNYCHRKDIPEGLLYTWATMTMDIVRVDQSFLEEIADTIAENIKNVSLGDTSVSYGGNEVTSTSKKAIDDIIFNYAKELQGYRRMSK